MSNDKRAVVQAKPPVPQVLTLPDGRRLSSPEPRQPRDLQVGEWVRLGGEPWRITDLRVRPAGSGGGRIIHLDGHRPVSVTEHNTVPVYIVSPPTGAGR